MAFRTLKNFRQNAIPMTAETAASLVGACLRAEKPDVAAHVLNFNKQLRVWPSGEARTHAAASLPLLAIRGGSLTGSVRFTGVLGGD